MKILLTIKSGTRASVRKTITGEWLRVGRNAACEIHLPDPRVPLDQGMVVEREGLVYIEGEAGSQNITRKTVRSMRLEPGQPIARPAKVSDFARDHPAFQVKPVASNLAFPHAVHLDPAGVRSPLQGRMKLDCKSCHQPDATRRTFQAISMPKHCQECHTLQFEPAVTTREVPHGKPADAVVVVEEFYANIALKGLPDSFVKAFGVPGEGLLRRVGDPTPVERQSALALASRKAKQVSGELQLAQVDPKRRRPSLLSWLALGIGHEPGMEPKPESKEIPKKAVKCDMCKDLPGGAACVRACPTGAAIRVSPEQFLSYAGSRE